MDSDDEKDENRRFRMRDLRSSKVYRVGAKLWGAHGSRRRIIVAPPMSSMPGGERRPWLLSPPPPAQAAKPCEETGTRQEWLQKRRQLRHQLEEGCSVQKFLSCKQPTPLEASVAKRLPCLQRTDLGSNMMVEDDRESPTHAQLPAVVTEEHQPLAMATIMAYRDENKLRLIDVFTRADKNKDWQVSVEELRRLVSVYNLPLSDGVLDELLEMVDADKSGTIDYREFVHGYERMVQCVRSGTFDKESAQAKAKDIAKKITQTQCAEQESKKSPPTTSDRSSQSLQSSDQCRKMSTGQIQHRKSIPFVRNEEFFLSSHLACSTLSNPARSDISAYRQRTADEYKEAVAMCERNGVPLSRELLQLALLHPGDHPCRSCLTAICQPGAGSYDLLSREELFEAIEKSLARPSDTKKRKKLNSDSKMVTIDTFAAYRANEPVHKTVKLPTGDTLVKPLVDCWMTRAEFQHFSRKFDRYRHFYTDQMDNPNLPPQQRMSKVWPGYMLDRLRLWMPIIRSSATAKFFHPGSNGSKSIKSTHPLFSCIHRQTSNLRTSSQHVAPGNWSVNSSGYVQHGTLTERRCHV